MFWDIWWIINVWVVDEAVWETINQWVSQSVTKGSSTDACASLLNFAYSTNKFGLFDISYKWYQAVNVSITFPALWYQAEVCGAEMRKACSHCSWPALYKSNQVQIYMNLIVISGGSVAQKWEKTGFIVRDQLYIWTWLDLGASHFLAIKDCWPCVLLRSWNGFYWPW